MTLEDTTFDTFAMTFSRERIPHNTVISFTGTVWLEEVDLYRVRTLDKKHSLIRVLDFQNRDT
jgi:hypothetical protein